MTRDAATCASDGWKLACAVRARAQCARHVLPDALRVARYPPNKRPSFICRRTKWVKRASEASEATCLDHNVGVCRGHVSFGFIYIGHRPPASRAMRVEIGMRHVRPSPVRASRPAGRIASRARSPNRPTAPHPPPTKMGQRASETSEATCLDHSVGVCRGHVSCGLIYIGHRPQKPNKDKLTTDVGRSRCESGVCEKKRPAWVGVTFAPRAPDVQCCVDGLPPSTFGGCEKNARLCKLAAPLSQPQH